MKISINVYADDMDQDSWRRSFEKRQDLYGLLQTLVTKVFEQIDREPSICQHPEDADVLRDANGNVVGTLTVEI